MKFESILIGLIASSSVVSHVSGHAKFHCPVPRSQESGVKNGPCGPYSRGANVAELQPGPQTFHFQETIAHTGAPMRLALSMNGDDNFEDCILLNHIPNSGTRTAMYYSITVDLPDIDCPKCSLQLIQVMTDKIATPTCLFDPQATTSSDGGRCFSNYFSCVDIAIKGKTPVAQYTCPAQPQDWINAAKPKYTYEKGLVSTWTAAGPDVNVLSAAPASYQQVTGYCSAAANMPGQPIPPTPAPETGDNTGDTNGGTGTGTGTGSGTGGSTNSNSPSTPTDGGGDNNVVIIGALAGAGVLIVAGAVYMRRKNANTMALGQPGAFNMNGQNGGWGQSNMGAGGNPQGWGSQQSHYYNDADPRGHLPPPRGPPPI